jgi:hypothetical protein
VLDLTSIDNVCALLAVAGLLLGILGAISIRLAYPLPASSVDCRCHRPARGPF